MKLSISTCWNSHRQEDGYAMLEELRSLGFEYVELSHGVRLSLIPGILKGVDEGLMRVSSVHNFCPLPPGVLGAAPNLYEPTSKNKMERALWRNHTLKTIDFASRIGAPLVVIHSGSVRFFWGSPEAKFEKLKETEGTTEEELAESLKRTMKKIDRKKKGYMKRLKESLSWVIPRAKEKGIKLGLENREGLQELPFDDEWKTLLEEIGEPETVGYWHDCGHAQLKERLGIISHESLLSAGRDRQFGFHLHDVSEDDKDHQIPGSGVIDWNMVKKYIRPENDILVMEMSPRMRSEGIRIGKAFLEEKLGI